ncbi:MAG: hypothetical protein WDZ35_16440 [Crocinitomicaceae bacterium]
MKSRILHLSLFIAFLSFLTVSCQKSLADEHIKYLGSWGSDDYSIEIWKDGHGVYEKRNKGKIDCFVKVKGNRLIFESGAINHKKFNIDQDPHQDTNGNTIMILDGDTFYKH